MRFFSNRFKPFPLGAFVLIVKNSSLGMPSRPCNILKVRIMSMCFLRYKSEGNLRDVKR